MSDIEGPTAGTMFPPAPDPRPPRELNVTWGRAVRVWWALTWRTVGIAMLVGGLSGCLIGALVGLVGSARHVDQATVNAIITMITMPTGIVLGLMVSVWTTRAVLEKRFREFRIALIAN
jgi:hypothetical protein